MSGKTRSLYGTAFKHFINSLKPRQYQAGVFQGSDEHGNKYYEIAADPSRGKRHPKRWFVPVSEENHREEMIPFEWNAWLRYRRSDAPSESEIVNNAAFLKMQKENADKLISKEESKNKETIKKAFDKVPHRRFLQKLQAYGIRGPIHRWIEAFLVGRTPAVCVNNTHSSMSSFPIYEEYEVTPGEKDRAK